DVPQCQRAIGAAPEARAGTAAAVAWRQHRRPSRGIPRRGRWTPRGAVRIIDGPGRIDEARGHPAGASARRRSETAVSPPAITSFPDTMKSFLNACGFWEPLRLIVEGPRSAGGEPRTLPQPFAVVGRDPRADVILDDLKVSRRHVYIQAVAG